MFIFQSAKKIRNCHDPSSVPSHSRLQNGVILRMGNGISYLDQELLSLGKQASFIVFPLMVFISADQGQVSCTVAVIKRQLCLQDCAVLIDRDRER